MWLFWNICRHRLLNGHANEFSLLKHRVNQAIQNVVTAIKSISIEICQDIKMDFMILTSLIVRLELYGYSSSELLSSVFTMMANLDDSMLLAFSSNFIESFISYIERYYSKLSYELNEKWVITTRHIMTHQFRFPHIQRSFKYEDSLSNSLDCARKASKQAEKCYNRVNSKFAIWISGKLYKVVDDKLGCKTTVFI